MKPRLYCECDDTDRPFTVDNDGWKHCLTCSHTMNAPRVRPPQELLLGEVTEGFGKRLLTGFGLVGGMLFLFIFIAMLVSGVSAGPLITIAVPLAALIYGLYRINQHAALSEMSQLKKGASNSWALSANRVRQVGADMMNPAIVIPVIKRATQAASMSMAEGVGVFLMRAVIGVVKMAAWLVVAFVYLTVVFPLIGGLAALFGTFLICLGSALCVTIVGFILGVPIIVYGLGMFGIPVKLIVGAWESPQRNFVNLSRDEFWSACGAGMLMLITLIIYAGRHAS